VAIQRWYKPVVIQRATHTTNSAGRTNNDGWSEHLVTTGLLAEPSQSRNAYIAQKYQVLQPYFFYTDIGQDIKQGDRVVYDAKNYRIVSNPRDTIRRGHHFVFVCEALDGEV